MPAQLGGEREQLCKDTAQAGSQARHRRYETWREIDRAAGGDCLCCASSRAPTDTAHLRAERADLHPSCLDKGSSWRGSWASREGARAIFNARAQYASVSSSVRFDVPLCISLVPGRRLCFVNLDHMKGQMRYLVHFQGMHSGGDDRTGRGYGRGMQTGRSGKLDAIER